MSAFHPMAIVSFCLTFFFCKAAETEYLDMTYEMKEGLPMFPGITPFKKTLLENGTQPGGYWLQLEDISTCVHVGTHMDAPCHFVKGKWCINEIPFERLIAPGVVVDITDNWEKRSSPNLMPDDLEKWQKTYGKIPKGSVMILKTGWGKFWNDNEKYINGSDGNYFPSLSPEAATWLVNNTEIYGVGVETLSVDEGLSHTFEAHRILNEHNIYFIENMANVDKLPVTGATIFAMPIKITDSSGAPSRVFAKIPKE